jgi:hypothetical protein
VTAYGSAPATARLSGTSVRCVSALVSLRVTGLGISSVAWKLGNTPIKGRIIRSGTDYAARFRVSPGIHELSVNVTFDASSQTRPRTFHRTLVGCHGTD